jgi:hypothetical protein
MMNADCRLVMEEVAEEASRPPFHRRHCHHTQASSEEASMKRRRRIAGTDVAAAAARSMASRCDHLDRTIKKCDISDCSIVILRLSLAVKEAVLGEASSWWTWKKNERTNDAVRASVGYDIKRYFYDARMKRLLAEVSGSSLPHVGG